MYNMYNMYICSSKESRRSTCNISQCFSTDFSTAVFVLSTLRRRRLGRQRRPVIWTGGLILT